jgi:ligand-binding sensor domain-containing protein
MKTLILVPILLNLLLSLPVSGQRILKKKEIKNIQAESALCENEIFLWAKSNIGLLRHNKVNGKTWSITQANSILPSNNVTCVVMCGDGQTYIATIKGMALWDNYGMILLDTENTNLPENCIISLWLDAHENLYITTKNLGTYKGTGFPIKAYKLKKVTDRVDSAIKCDLFQRNSNDYLISNPFFSLNS